MSTETLDERVRKARMTYPCRKGQHSFCAGQRPMKTWMGATMVTCTCQCHAEVSK